MIQAWLTDERRIKGATAVKFSASAIAPTKTAVASSAMIQAAWRP